MKSRYNIALVPSNESNLIITYARFLADIADSYLLGEFSLPHITLYQFQSNECDIQSIWVKVCDRLNQFFIELTFEKFSCITFDQAIFWASLLPNKRNELMKIHSVVAEIVGQPIKLNYDPHMTLMNTKDPLFECQVNRLKQAYTSIKDNFVLALGKSDEVGQFTALLFSSEGK